MTEENIPATLHKLVVPIGDVKQRKHNPRRGDIDAIAESLERNGQYRPIVVNKPTGEILAGNHCHQAATKLGWKHIAVTFVDVDEDEAARIVLADNRTADLGDYDDTLLLNLLRSLDEPAGTGYTQEDIDALDEALGHTSPMSLDELEDKYGEPRDDDTWRTIAFTAPADVFEAWQARTADFGGDGAATLSHLLNATSE